MDWRVIIGDGWIFISIGIKYYLIIGHLWRLEQRSRRLRLAITIFSSFPTLPLFTTTIQIVDSRYS